MFGVVCVCVYGGTYGYVVTQQQRIRFVPSNEKLNKCSSQTHSRPAAHTESDQKQKRKPNQKYIMICELYTDIYCKCRRLESFRSVIGGMDIEYWHTFEHIPDKIFFLFYFNTFWLFPLLLLICAPSFLLYSIEIYKSVKLFEFDNKTHFRRDVSFLS